MSRILALIIFLMGIACCHGQTPDASTGNPSDEDRKRWADADARRKAETLATYNPSADTIVATVLDRKITMKDAARPNGIIFGTLLEKYAKENKIVPTDAELDTFIVGTDEGEKRHQSDLDSRKAILTQELQSSTITDRQRKDKESYLATVEQSLKHMQQNREQSAGREEQLRSAKLRVATQVVSKWKVDQALYAQYGGRVIFQQAGNEPMDAYRAFLKDEQAKGNFRILDAKYEAAFWEYFGVGNTSVYPKVEADRAMSTPWWLMKASVNH